MIPEASIDFIVAQETGGRAYYNRFACHPVWPGGASGITIGVGYDLGQIQAAQLSRDWGGVLDAVTLGRLTPAVGLRGGSTAADIRLQALIQQLRDITVGWDMANQVFRGVSLPLYEAQTLATFPGVSALPGPCIGAMVSLVYNRGSALAGASRIEMLRIRELIQGGMPEGVPEQIRAMKRLWPNIPGLQKRRDAEADMFQQGLDSRVAAAVA